MGTRDDCFVPEPCNRIPSGRLLSLGALNHNAEKEIGVEPHAFQMGELTRAPGEFGRRTTTPLYTFMLSQSGVRVAAAGVADFTFGTDFVQRDLGTMTDQANVRLLCANAVDVKGRMLLRAARALLGGRSDARGRLAEIDWDVISAAGTTGLTIVANTQPTVISSVRFYVNNVFYQKESA